jgi:murein DD-endopeptidase MepM/ murein hydrolase activator NlpD
MVPIVAVYVFPFEGRKVSYGTTHHDYPAIDVFGCGATVVAPTAGTVTEARSIDLWDSKVNDPATRGGKYVTLLGDDGVRYYFAHLASLDTALDARVAPGDALGVMGQTGNARLSACHTHVGISWPCATTEWQVRRGEIWPSTYLDAWRAGEQLSPVSEVVAGQIASPQACADAARAKSAAAA